MKTRFSDLSVTYTKGGLARYRLEMWHDGLNKHREIKGDDGDVVLRKAQYQADTWNEMWERVSAKEDARATKMAGKHYADRQKEVALERTTEAQENFDALTGLLAHTLRVNDAVDWETLKKNQKYDVTRPQRYIASFPKPVAIIPSEPKQSDSAYKPVYRFLDKLIPSRQRRIQEELARKFELDRQGWLLKAEAAQEEHAKQLEQWERDTEKWEREFQAAIDEWTKNESIFLEQQSEENSAIERKRYSYEAKEVEAVLEYCDLVLSSSIYPDYFPQEFDLDYDASSQTLIVDYVLPAPEAIPRLKSVKYVASRDQMEEQYLSDQQVFKLYDEVLYQVVLRTVHELFEADIVNALMAVVFNGIVTSLDRSSGKNVTACVLSLRADKTEFLDINLALVDPKSCFKALKGVGSSKLYGLAPIPPIMQLRREDGRFVSSYEVANTLDESVNLAAMDWEDFEHLIRDIFEKEFSSTGGEVRVTQASRDGGVDAVAFDPDPIRGGKIVIQAKRYTNTVSVGAVRDLYGTVVNEGATKGVLVTTSDYGPDSYAFANGKPLVLLNGANLLHMLERHGHRARIDISEAKKMLGNA